MKLAYHAGKSPYSTCTFVILLCMHPILTRPTKHACGQCQKMAYSCDKGRLLAESGQDEL